MASILFRSIGALGIALIVIGILNKQRARQDLFYIAGGVCLEVYSLYLRDPIFIALQVVFIAAGVYDLAKLKKK